MTHDSTSVRTRADKAQAIADARAGEPRPRPRRPSRSQTHNRQRHRRELRAPQSTKRAPRIRPTQRPAPLLLCWGWGSDVARRFHARDCPPHKPACDRSLLPLEGDRGAPPTSYHWRVIGEPPPTSYHEGTTTTCVAPHRLAARRPPATSQGHAAAAAAGYMHMYMCHVPCAPPSPPPCARPCPPCLLSTTQACQNLQVLL